MELIYSILSSSYFWFFWLFLFLLLAATSSDDDRDDENTTYKKLGGVSDKDRIVPRKRNLRFFDRLTREKLSGAILWFMTIIGFIAAIIQIAESQLVKNLL
ncbi:MAG: hypothetical protein AAF826_03570 [Pseudomonadota bacterium]